MFEGEHSLSLDEKGRVSIPRRFRAELGEPARVVVAHNFLGQSPHLVVYPLPVWHSFIADINRDALLDGDVADFSRLVSGSSRTLEADRQGRIAIPADMRDYAGLAGEAVWLGVGPRMEIWSGDRLEGERTRLRADLPSIRERLLARRAGAGR